MLATKKGFLLSKGGKLLVGCCPCDIVDVPDPCPEEPEDFGINQSGTLSINFAPGSWPGGGIATLTETLSVNGRINFGLSPKFEFRFEFVPGTMTPVSSENQLQFNLSCISLLPSGATLLGNLAASAPLGQHAARRVVTSSSTTDYTPFIFEDEINTISVTPVNSQEGSITFERIEFGFLPATPTTRTEDRTSSSPLTYSCPTYISFIMFLNATAVRAGFDTTLPVIQGDLHYSIRTLY